MSFVYPAALLLLALVLPLAVREVIRRERRRRAALAEFGELSVLSQESALPTARTSMRRAALQLGALGLGFLALARPQLGERETQLAQTGRDILVLLDLSRSMTVPDVGGTRLARAKQIIRETVSASAGDRLGLVVFGGSAFLQLPLTTDHATFRLFLDAATPDDLADPATNLSNAFATAARTFEHEGERGRRAVLIVSDGEAGEGGGGLDDALSGLRRQAVPVFAIGVGTPAGAPVPADSSEAPERYHRDHIGRIAVSRLMEDQLREAAQTTAGRYARWDRSPDRKALARALAKVENRTLGTQSARERADRFQWPVALAVLLLVMDGWMRWGAELGQSRAGRAPVASPTAVVGLLLGMTAFSMACFDAERRGIRLYDAGKYAEAARAFGSAMASDTTPRLAFNSGDALYRMKHYQDAAKRFRLAAVRGGPLRQHSLYNLGNAMVRVAEESPGKAEPLLQAIAAYEGALRLDPTDVDAKWNLELAVRRLDEDRASGGSAGRGRRGDYGRGNMNTPGYEGNPEEAVGAMAGGGFGSAEGESAEELNPEEARQLLETVQREELSSHEGRPAREGRSEGQDW